MSTSNKDRGIWGFYMKLVPLDPLRKTLELFRYIKLQQSPEVKVNIRRKRKRFGTAHSSYQIIDTVCN